MASGHASRIAALGQLPGWPLMLCDVGAAAFVGLPVARFHRAVEHGELPQPKRLAGLERWNRNELERLLDLDAGFPAGSDHDAILTAIAVAEVR